MNTKNSSYRDSKRPGRKGYDIDDAELARLFKTKMALAEIAGLMNISVWTALKHLKKLGLRRTQRHPISRQDAFAVITADTCYWGGFLAADGYTKRNGIGIELAALDADHIKTLCRFVGRDEQLCFRQRHRRGKTYRHVSVDLLSLRIKDDLGRHFGIVPRKSVILEPPDLPQDMQRHFIRGYFDGDGCVSWHKDHSSIRLCFASGSEKLLEWISETIRKETQVTSLMTIVKRKSSRTHVFELYGEEAIKVLNWMYADGGDAICLERKKRKFESCCGK